ncbi:MAG: M20/M25/M40 family metallo-hydrolase [Ardenticatenaceae bacterium]|nr:M20/M25/M40 family metallo-hydrolase [Ardenticatenaceae bacterium]
MNSLAALLRDLVAINSVNPTLAGGPGETELARWCTDWLRAAGLDPVLQEAAPNRPNVVVLVAGQGQAPPLLLNAHLDTVGGEGNAGPLALRQEGDRLYGRGGYDMKGSIAVLLELARSFATTPPPGDLWITLVADEEDLSVGTEALLRDWLPTLDRPPAAALVLEPTEENIGVAHKGFAWFEIEMQGRAAHGSRPDEGIDAIMPLGAALTELLAVETALASQVPVPLLGTPSLHASTIAGGTAWSVYPAMATLRWERRTLPGEDDLTLASELHRVVAAAQRSNQAEVRGRHVFSRAPLGTPSDAAVVRALHTAAPGARLVGLPFWTDGALFSAAAIPTVLYGPIGHGAHAVDEWVSAASLECVAATLRALVAAGAWAA